MLNDEPPSRAGSLLQCHLLWRPQMIANSYPAGQQVMVLYTGGTIGMQASANGLAPASGFEARMRDYLHSQPELVVPQWRFREMSPLIDSANMTPAYWQQLREAVVDAVDVQG